MHTLLAGRLRRRNVTAIRVLPSANCATLNPGVPLSVSERSWAISVIEVNNLRKKYGDIEALKGVSFRVQAREIYGLLGPNGAGKSTTIGILCGLVTPDAGQASLNGIDIARRPVDARRVLGVVPQEVALYSEFSARDNLAFFGRLYGLSGAALRGAIERALARVSLADRATEPIEGYSGGMLRRLNIAAGSFTIPRSC